MKKITVIALLLAAALGAQARNGSGKPAYKDAGRPVEERVSDLLSRMTLEEKVMQLNQYTLGRNDNANNVADPVDKIPAEIGSLIYFDTSPGLRNRLQKKAIEQSRLGIPVLFGYDVIHGFRTTYPISLAQACSWNPALVKQAAEVAAQEARMSGVEWTFSPMIDVARDGRWGRVSEGYGEDPYANAVYGVAAVKGYQGDNLADSRRVAACLKHFVGYGASEAGRDYVYTEISRQTLWDTYIPPYQAGIEAGAATVMSCFNDISGTPGTANPYILTEVLKERWAHDGFVVSDWAAIEQLRSQGVAADRKEAAEKAFNAGVEMDMMNRCYDAHLAALVREGKVSQEKLDEAVRRVLRLKFRLGLFERPYTPESEETDRFLLPASLAVAERLAEESMVLLKNENNTLPLKVARRIAVIGPMAQNRLHLLGAWSAHGREEDAVSLFAGWKTNTGAAPNCSTPGAATSTARTAPDSVRLSPRPRLPTWWSSVSGRKSSGAARTPRARRSRFPKSRSSWPPNWPRPENRWFWSCPAAGRWSCAASNPSAGPWCRCGSPASGEATPWREFCRGGSTPRDASP